MFVERLNDKNVVMILCIWVMIEWIGVTST